MAELEQVAREAGIEPSAVRQAVQEFEEAQQRPLLTRVLGAPVRHTIERVVEGEVSVEDHEVLVAEIRAALGPESVAPPQVSAVGRTLTVNASSGYRAVEVTVAPRAGAGRTTVRITVNEAPLAGTLMAGMVTPIVTTLPVLGLVFVNGGGNGALAVAGAVMAAVTAGASGLGRALFMRSSARADGVLQGLANSLARQLEAKRSAAPPRPVV